MDQSLALPLLDQALLDDSLLAGWERVRDNAGSPGVDGLTIATFGRDVLQRLPALRQRVMSGHYAAQPLRRISLPRSGKAPRILAVPCVADRVVQSAVALTLAPRLDPGFEDFSYGYRPGRSVPKAVQSLCDARDAGLCWVAEADIQSCFDNIPWAPLLQRLSDRLPESNTALLLLLRHWLGLPLQWPDGTTRARACGVPQGSPLSPLLSNVYLDALDKALAEGPWRAVRYADDFVIAAASREQAQAGLDRAARWLNAAGLRLNREKTRVVHVDQGFTFLGVCFQGGKISAERPGAEPWVLPRAAKPASKPATAMRRRADVAAAQAFSPAPTRTAPRPAAASAVRAGASKPRPAPESGAERAAAQQAAAVQPPAQPLPPRLRTLYITEPGAYLHIDGERFIVGKGEDELASIPAEKVDQVVADSEGAVSFGAMRLLLRHDATLLLTNAPGEHAGLFAPMAGRQVQLRAAQFARLTDGAFRIAAARRIVQTKIANSRVLLKRYQRFRPESDSGQDAGLARLHIACAHTTTLDSVRGHEGMAARLYFEAFGALLGSQWGFDARNRQPPKDPVNALLSYGYAVLFHTVHTFILRRGLDPYVGALHAPRDGHAALASDLMEPYRSLVVDATVLRLLTGGQIKYDDFAAEQPGRIPLDVKRTYIHALEKKLHSPVGRDDQGEALDWRRLIERDVDGWAALVQGQAEAYAPWAAR
ncbi:MAG: CRISPR-associated endonuclease Cas1 [Thiomonas sp. 13-66-29]|jgi:CRISPR-associated protein Cas1|nr:MAG: CRISPR-associated endonuclease Cas1 [Thiomonas sp. 13-66-29]